MKSEGKLITHDGTSLIIPVKKKTLFDLLPDPREVAKDIGTGLSDASTAASWLYGEAGKAPR